MIRAGTALLCVLLYAVCGHAAGAEPPYPAAGSPEPPAPCARKDADARLDFFCRYLTLDRWLQSGRPDYVDAGGKHWQPWFYGRDGLTNQLLVEGRDYLPGREGWFEALFDVGNFDAQTYSYFWDLFRYAPWSVQFLYAGGCSGGQVLNPYELASGRYRRMHILGLGWPGFTADPADPARAFDPAALPVLLPLANPHYPLEPALRPRYAEAGALRADVNALAAGRGGLWPDFARDGGVWLIDRDGAATALDDLDAAAARLAAVRLLVVNDAPRSWDSGYRVAAEIARARGSLLYLYFAQDPFTPVDDGGVFSRRLRYLLARTAAALPTGAGAEVISHGRSAGVVARAAAGYGAIVHRSYAPLPSPLDRGGKDTPAAAGGRIDVLAPGWPPLGGHGSGPDAAACLGNAE